jgi:hypothetical protein
LISGKRKMMDFQPADFFLGAIVVAWNVNVVVGLIWFQPRLFGNGWSPLTGQELKPAPKWIIPGFLGHLAMIFVLAVSGYILRVGQWDSSQPNLLGNV